MSDISIKQKRAVIALRVVVAAIMFIHGIARVRYGTVGSVGAFFSQAGFPLGLVIAWSITIFELIGSVLLAVGVFVAPIACVFIIELVMGIILIYSKAGWFVVGRGSNGMEFSVLLIAVMAAVAYSHFDGWKNSISKK